MIEPPPNDPAPPKPGLRIRPLVAGLAVLIPLVPIVVGLLLSGGGGSARAQTTTAAAAPSHFSPVVQKPIKRPRSSLLPPGKGALVALVQRPTTMRAKPGGPTVAKVSTQTTFGSSQTFWVVRVSGRWLGVISNLAGNNRVGWIRATDASLSRVNWELRASLSARELTVMHAGKAIRHFSIAVGAPAAPTPTGRFAVTDRLHTGDPAGPYGCCILALSAEAPHAIEDWSGGNRIAIHSTPETDSIGHPVSHGCMRLTLAEGRWLLSHIPLGTPAVVSA